MTYYESLDFIYRLIFARFDLVVWLWSIIAFGLTMIIVHWLWGKAWNKQWAFFKRPVSAITSIILGLTVMLSVLTWLAAERSSEWLELQRIELTRQYTDSGLRNRRILTEAQNQLGNESMVGENALRIRNTAELQLLTEVAAGSVRCPLTQSGPLGPGAPCRMRDPVSVAQEVMQSTPAAIYPMTLSPDNLWISGAVATQVQEALSYATPKLRTGMRELQDFVYSIFWIAIIAQIILVAISAISDIRIHPTQSW